MFREFFVPIALLGFWVFLMGQVNAPLSYADAVYELRNLPPLSTKGKWGIFQSDTYYDQPEFVTNSRLLYYSPSTHKGVQTLMDELKAQYPQVELRGVKNSDDLNVEYQSNLFETWAAIQFDLSDEQIESDSLIPSSSSPVTVSYQIRVAPASMVRERLHYQ